MDTSKRVDGTREVTVEAWNMLLGKAIFCFIYLPESWVTGYQLDEPFVTNRFMYKGRVWVGSGDTECLISRTHGEEKRPELDFRMKLVVEMKKEFLTAPSPEDLIEKSVKKGYEVVDYGDLNTGGHSGSYILWTSNRPRFGFLGSPSLKAQMVGYVPCEDTSRLFKIIWTSPKPELLLDQSDVLVSTLNQILCHGHDVASYDDDLV